MEVSGRGGPDYWNMQVLVTPVPAGARAFISTDASAVGLTSEQGDQWVDPWTMERRGEPAAKRELDLTPDGPGHVFWLCRFEIPVVQLHRDTLRFLRAGHAVSDRLAGPPPDGSHGEMRRSLLALLREDADHVYAVGVVVRLDAGPLGPDDNLVAVLDILGFREIVRRHTLDELQSKLAGALLGALDLAVELSSVAFLLDDAGRPRRSPLTERVQHAIMSDTILLYLRNPFGDPLRTMVDAASCVIEMAVAMGWLLRGAIDVGPFRALADHQLCFGEALVSAYDLGQAHAWGGCVVSERVREQFPEAVSRLLGEGLLVDYKVPTYTDAGRLNVQRKPALAVNWCFFSNKEFRDRRHALQAQLKHAPHKPARKKVAMALRFVEDMMNQGLESVRPRVGQVVVERAPGS